MATEQIIDINLGLVYNPLNITYGITVEGNVPGEQTYDQSTSQYTPDYTVTHLVLKPWLNVVDPDGIIPDGAAAIANPRWLAFEGGVKIAVETGSDYTVQPDGTLSVKRNASSSQPLTLRFEGEYQDSRTGEIYKMIVSHTVVCEAVAGIPTLMLDAPLLMQYNPIDAKGDNVRVRAFFKLGSEPVDPLLYELVWEKKDIADTDYSPILLESEPGYDPMDYDVELASDRRSLLVRRNLMGRRIDIRVRARYDPYGNPSSVTLDESSPAAYASFVRNIPKPTVSALSARRFEKGQMRFYPEARLYMGNKEIASPDKWFEINWYMSQNNASGTVSRGTAVAVGAKPTIPTERVAKTYGATASVGVREKDPPKALCITEGGAAKLLTIGGKILII